MITLAALTLDLDDTLWPVWPAIERAEARLIAWLAEHAPATAAAHDRKTLRLLRDAVAAEQPGWAHDLSRIRLESIRRALQQHDEDPALAEAAFEAFFEERQRVDLFADVLPALDRLAARWPIVAVSNGNADVGRVGLGRYFRASVSAREFGRGKPEAAIFHHACSLAGAAHGAVLHIGDDGVLDVDGALGAGLRAAWIERPDLPPPAAPRGTPHHRIADLLTLADQLGA
ncbi:HAD-IA family hydrolase [Aquincola sp. S2]|uniref:HAD-IA family hydrolase n=1 Tax=Pseudaquabacterium terrae TaxID=2732868 RepID=A0ABX2EQF6_9BURK|nr:HAD-IA family hydrolase [Aquabacterium terrae]NRF70937.1 HAD-IA family hydrolase [Aquabacterium terrae]